MIKTACIAGLVLLVQATTCGAENYIVTGDMRSKIRYELQQRISPAPGISEMKLSCVIPRNSKSVTFEQEISTVALNFVPDPQKKSEQTDRHGNRIITAVWKKPEGDTLVKLSFDARTRTRLDLLNTKSPFPLNDIPPDKKVFLLPTKQVQSLHPDITALSSKLTIGSTSQFDAVQRLITWLWYGAKTSAPKTAGV